MLLRHLPQDSHYQTALRETVEFDEPPADADPVFGPWSLLNHQIAALTDAVNRIPALTNGGQMPDPMPRPKPKTRRASSSLDMAKVAYLQEIRDRHRLEGGD